MRGKHTFAKLTISGLIFAGFVGNVLVGLYHHGVYKAGVDELFVPLVLVGIGAAFFISAMRDVS